jgi:uncharacterized membrane protein YgdD (TMEM256/DUF423 family)
MSGKTLVTAVGLLGALTVALGAFAAHGLRKLVKPDTLAVFETGVRYQFYHVLALLLTCLIRQPQADRFVRMACSFFLAGILLFSGSLYLLTYVKFRELDALYWIGAITPVGGLCFIMGWLSLIPALRKMTKAAVD